GAVRDIADELEQRRLGPVQVLEDQRDWPATREQLEHAPDRPVQLLSADARSSGLGRGGADERRERRRDGPRLRSVALVERLDQGRELRGRRRVVVAVQYPGGI